MKKLSWSLIAHRDGVLLLFQKRVIASWQICRYTAETTRCLMVILLSAEKVTAAVTLSPRLQPNELKLTEISGKLWKAVLLVYWQQLTWILLCQSMLIYFSFSSHLSHSKWQLNTYVLLRENGNYLQWWLHAFIRMNIFRNAFREIRTQREMACVGEEV